MPIVQRIALLALVLALMGQDSCDETTPPGPEPPKVSDFCHANDFGVLNNVSFGYEQDGVMGGLAAILNGNPSDTPRGTVQVTFGGAYCTGVALGPKVVLTAGHCGYAPTTSHTVKVYRREFMPHMDGPVTQPVVMKEASTATGLPAKEGEESFAYNAAVFEALDGGPIELVYSSVATKHVVHSDYLEYTQTGNYEKRKSDLMLLFLDEPLPEASLIVAGVYSKSMAEYCNGCLAQGYGRWEGDYLDLRESEYVVTSTSDPKLLTSVANQVPPGEDHGPICFGDSGGPLYCDVGGVVYLAGVTSTTMSSDCLVGGNHVNVAYFWEQWILPTIAQESNEAT